jgi:hypothetical protein
LWEALPSPPAALTVPRCAGLIAPFVQRRGAMPRPPVAISPP